MSQVKLMIMADIARDGFLCLALSLYTVACLHSMSIGDFALGTYAVRAAPAAYIILEAMSQVPEVYIAVGLATSASRSPTSAKLTMCFRRGQWLLTLAVVAAVGFPEVVRAALHPIQVDGCWRLVWVQRFGPLYYPAIVLSMVVVTICTGCYIFVFWKTHRTSSLGVSSRALRNMGLYLLVCSIRSILLMFFFTSNRWQTNMKSWAFCVVGISLWSSVGDLIICACTSRHLRQTYATKNATSGDIEDAKKITKPISLTVGFGNTDTIDVPDDGKEARSRAARQTRLVNDDIHYCESDSLESDESDPDVIFEGVCHWLEVCADADRVTSHNRPGSRADAPARTFLPPS